MPLRTWFVALYLLTQSKTNVAGLELTRHLGVCQRTAWRIKHKIMEAMSRQEAARQLRGFVKLAWLVPMPFSASRVAYVRQNVRTPLDNALPRF